MHYLNPYFAAHELQLDKTKDTEEKVTSEEHKKVKQHEVETEEQAATRPEGIAVHPSGQESKLAHTDGDRLTTDPI